MSETKENSRVETFCDGVFAIAITLLILEIKIPPVSTHRTAHELQEALLEDWPSWFGFLLSFTIILVSWVNHHIAINLVSKSSPQFIYANGFLLLTVVILPFATELMAEYLNTGFGQPAVTFYCFSLLLHNIAWNVLGWTVMHPHSLARDVHADRHLQIHLVKFPRFAFIIYSGICALSFWFPGIAMALITASWIGWIITSIRPVKKI